MERRAFHEVRADGRSLTGYAARFDSTARIGGFNESIKPGAFKRLDKDILALVDHDPHKLLARSKTGTLELAEDDQGLAFRIALPDTQLGRDVLVMAERGDLGGMSFGFTVPKGGERWSGRSRELTDVDLKEISVVHSWPAYDGTSVSARAKHSRLDRARLYLETVTSCRF